MRHWQDSSKIKIGRRKPLTGLRMCCALEPLEPRTVLSTGYLQLSVASDQPAAALVQDPNLVGPWGIALNSNGGDLWLSDRTSGLASLYSGGVGGSPFQADPLVVSIPGGSPTGVVPNSSTSFVVQSGAASGPASFLFGSDSGNITGWSSNVPPPAPSASAQTAATTAGAVYKGLALATNGGQNLLYAADFHDNRIDVFNSTFNRISLAGNFNDPNLPVGYAPFNIANIGGRLLVSYAMQDATGHNDVPGVSHGIVDAFDYNGNFLRTLINGGPLNSPWGMAVAPAGFGDFSGELLVANAGDGKINAFDPTTGLYQGTLASPSGNPLVLNGVHGLSFGNGLTAGDGNALFFTALGAGGQQGTLGEIVSAQANSFPALGNVISPTAGVTFNGVVAVFNDWPAAAASGFMATIFWGDGAVSVGTVSALPSGGFGVSGSHAYSQSGHQNITVQVRDPQSNVATANGGANIAPPGLVFNSSTVAATEGFNFSGTVTSFIDQDHNFASGVYSATIDWGDGTTTSGTVVGTGSPFDVNGAHTYATQGSDLITVTVQDNFDGATGVAHVTATVSSSLSGTAKTIAATESSAYSGTVATFTDANTSRPISDYGATINWGDGTVSPGTITANGNGGYNVTGLHTYGDDGTQSVAVAITDPGSTITVASTADVADIDTLTATASPVSASEGLPFNGNVATFTDTLASAAANDFAATIDWGDGVTTPGTITETAGVFTIAGAHTYADEGSFNINSTLRDVGGTATATAHSAAAIADSDVLAVAPVTFAPAAGTTFTGTVATFSDSYAAAAAGDFNASIQWGDGMTTTGAITGGSGNFTVTGSHAYASEGDHTAVIVVADDPPGTAAATATATVTVSAGPIVVTAVPVNEPERTPETVDVATFSQAGSNASASDYNATIAWGDGTTSLGTVSTDGSGFAVSGTHAYADEGHYNFAVAVNRNGGAPGTVAGVATVVETLLADGTAGNPNTRYVNEVYGDLLHRAADSGALTFWGGQLSAGMTRLEFVSLIESSGEYRGDEVQQVFQTYLHRAADPSAMAFGSDFLATHTVEQLAGIVAGSPEYYQNRGGSTNDGFLDALFHDALNRPVDGGARAYFDHLLAAGTSRSQVAASIFASDEYLNDVVEAAYLNLLDRPADPGGQSYFAGQLKQGWTDAQVAAALSASDEYFAKTSD